jgi:hypothetical protein
MMLKASKSGIISPSKLADLQREIEEDPYQKEFECSFVAAIKDALYADEMCAMVADASICPIEINKDVRVSAAWDRHRCHAPDFARAGRNACRRSLW